MSLSSGTYTIYNYMQKRVAFVNDNIDKTPVTGENTSNQDKAKWDVTKNNDTFTIVNKGTGTSANTGTRAQIGDPVLARSVPSPQEFSIQQTADPKYYTIATTDTNLVWRLDDNQAGAVVTIQSTPADRRAWWSFQ